MGYMHIDNLYKDQRLLQFKEVYALEKIHGTSAHISYDGIKLTFFAGGCSHERFTALFDADKLLEVFKSVFAGDMITIHGEAYGGSIQKMSHTYGKDIRFVAFDVKIGDLWLDVPSAESFVQAFGLEFVHYVKIPTTLEAVDKEMMRDSVQAIRNGVGEGRPSEGVVLRPPFEVRLNNGTRLIAKHKKAEFSETATPRPVVDPSKLKVLEEATAIAQEWVVAERLRHVASAIGKEIQTENIRLFIPAMIADVKREAEGEVVWSPAVEKAIGKATANLIQQMMHTKLQEQSS